MHRLEGKLAAEKNVLKQHERFLSTQEKGIQRSKDAIKACKKQKTEIDEQADPQIILLKKKIDIQNTRLKQLNESKQKFNMDEMQSIKKNISDLEQDAAKVPALIAQIKARTDYEHRSRYLKAGHCVNQATTCKYNVSGVAHRNNIATLATAEKQIQTLLARQRENNSSKQSLRTKLTPYEKTWEKLKSTETDITTKLSELKKKKESAS